MSQIRSILELNCDKFLSSIKSVNESIETLKKNAAAAVAAFEGLKLGGEAIVAQFQKMHEALELGAQLQDLSAQTGQGAGDLLILRQACINAGMGADALQPMLRGLNKALAGINEEGQPTKAVFDKLGISIQALRSMSATARSS